jgi:lysophospholipase L1-like esterase
MGRARFFARIVPILFSAIAIAQAPAPITLYVIGDSTASMYKPDRSPRMGWAQVLQEFFDPGKLVVDDRALSGRSSKSFVDEGAWAKVEAALKPGDNVFIQFGHNDSKKDDPKRFTDPATTYRKYLKDFADAARAKGAVPVIVTSINRYRFKGEHEVVDTLGDYPVAARESAKELGTPLIDLHMLTKDLFESLGQAKTKELFMYLEKGKYPNYPDGVEDGTHLQEKGARAISALVAKAIAAQKLPLEAYLRK